MGSLELNINKENMSDQSNTGLNLKEMVFSIIIQTLCRVLASVVIIALIATFGDYQYIQ